MRWYVRILFPDVVLGTLAVLLAAGALVTLFASCSDDGGWATGTDADTDTDADADTDTDADTDGDTDLGPCPHLCLATTVCEGLTEWEVLPGYTCGADQVCCGPGGSDTDTDVDTDTDTDTYTCPESDIDDPGGYECMSTDTCWGHSGVEIDFSYTCPTSGGFSQVCCHCTAYAGC